MASKKENAQVLVSLPEALEILEQREKDGDFGYEQTLALDYLKKFSKTSVSSAEKARKQLQELGISEKTSVSMINVMPTDIMQVKQILVNEKSGAEPETAEKAFAVLDAARKKDE